MPEIITKYPEIVLKILKETGAICGEGVQQQILKVCPPERFCSLPTGEICVYGVNEISKMTQIKTADLITYTQNPNINANLLFILFIFGLILGILITIFIKTIKKKP